MQSGMASRAEQPERLASNQQPEVSNWHMAALVPDYSAHSPKQNTFYWPTNVRQKAALLTNTAYILL